MTSKILKSILSVAVAVLLATLLVITGVLYQYFGGIQQSQLKDELSLAVNAVEQLGEDYLEALPSDRCRLTWVASDGTVLFDTRADAASMENHADREEIKEAMVSGTGSSSRNSATLTEQTIYEATRLDDGSVLRISVSRATAMVLVLGMLQPLAAIALAAIALSAWLAHRMAKRVVDPLNRLDLDKPMDNDAYEELSPLLRRIHAQHLPPVGQTKAHARVYLMRVSAQQAQHAAGVRLILRLAQNLVADAYQRVRRQHHFARVALRHLLAFGLRKLFHALRAGAGDMLFIRLRGIHHKRQAVERKQLLSPRGLGRQNDGLHGGKNASFAMRIKSNSLL